MHSQLNLRARRCTGLLLVSLGLLFLCIGPAPAAPQNQEVGPASPSQRLDVPLKLSTRTLDNGLVVAVVENPSVPLATIEVAVHNGSENEPLPLNGLSHLYEHMFFKGNAVVPNQTAYMKKLRDLGASFNGTTGEERVDYFFTLGADKLDAGLKFMSDAIKSPLFDGEELAREKEVVLGEFDRNEADPDYFLEHAITYALFYAHPTYKDPLGTRVSIKAATVAQMRWMQRVYYIPNNSILVVTGDVRADEVFALAQQYFGDWRRGPNPFIAHPLVHHPPLPAPKVLVVSQPVQTATVRLDWQGPSTGTDMKNAVVADVFSFAVNEEGSRLQKALVDSGLASRVRLDYDTLNNTGQIKLEIDTTPDKAMQATDVALREVRHFDDVDYVTDGEWRTAQTLLAVNDMFERERATQFGHTLTFWWAVADIGRYLDYIPCTRRLTRLDGARYCFRYMVGKPMVLALMTSPQLQEKYGISEGTLEAALQQHWAANPPRRKSMHGRHKSLRFESVAQTPTGAPDTLQPTATPAPSPAEIQPAPSPSPSRHKIDRPSVEQFDVDGIPVLLRSNPATPVVSVATFLRGGCENLTPQNVGIEDLAIALASQGSTTDMSRDERMGRLNAMGTSITYSAASDYSRINMKCLSGFFDPSVDLYAAGIARPAFAPQDVELLRRRQLNEIQEDRQNPDSEVDRLAEEFFYRGHPYALRPIGTIDAVARLSPEQVADYFKKLATRDRMLIVVVGNIERSQVEQALHRNFSQLPPGEAATLTPPSVHRRPSALTTEERHLPTTYVLGMLPAVPPGSSAYAISYLTASVLSDRLWNEVRTRRNLSYAVYAGDSSRKANFELLYLTSAHPNEAVKVMRYTIRQLADKPLTADALRGYVATLITQYYMRMESCDAQANQLGSAQIVAGDWAQAYALVDQVRDVSAQQVQAAARPMLNGIQWAVLGNVGSLNQKVFVSPLAADKHPHKRPGRHRKP